MNAPYDRLSWQLLQSFIAVAEQGSLSAAARYLGSSQPTLSRHLSTLEAELGQRLFDRSTDGMLMTAEGGALLERVQPMADAASLVRAASASGSSVIRGSVRVSASQIVATYVLPTVLADLRTQYPELSLEVVASDETHNLLRREADIAVRMYQPTQLDLVVRRMADIDLGLFAAPEYLQRKGPLEAMPDLQHHDVIGYDRSTLIIDGMRRMGMHVDRDFFAFRCDDQVVCWNMVKAGYGIGFMQLEIGQRDTDVVQLCPDIVVGSMPVWLVAHKDLNRNLRVRAVFDHLAAALSPKH